MSNKVAIISDTHFGIKKSDDTFSKSQIRFIENEFVPYLKEHNITKIFHLGDVFDSRNSINVKTKNIVYDLFDKTLRDFEIWVIPGNHDCYYNTSIDVNSIKWLKKFNNIHLIDSPTDQNIDGYRVLFVPWLVKNDDFAKHIAGNWVEAKICVGHFHINGANVNKQIVCYDGIDARIFFDNFRLIFSGHFHTRSTREFNGSELVYVGAPYHLTRNDVDEEKGFCILDLEYNTYEFVNNKTSMKYVKLTYPERFTKEQIENNIIDINIAYEDSKVDDFYNYIRSIEKYAPAFPPNIKMISDLQIINIDMANEDIKDLNQMMAEYIHGMPAIENKDEIIALVNRLYDESKKTTEI